MSDVAAAVRSRLVAHTGTAALIGTRAFFGALPQNPTLPASVVQQISGPGISAMGSDVGVLEARIQVKAYASTRAGAQALAVQHKAALKRYRGTSATVVVHDSFLADEDGDGIDGDTGFHSVRQDYMVWVTE